MANPPIISGNGARTSDSPDNSDTTDIAPRARRYTMTDKELKQHIENALDWDPRLNAKDVGVSVAEGVATLRGNVASFSERMVAERIALRVYGVKAVANDLIVKLPDSSKRTDTEIAQAAVAALKWNAVIPNDRVTIAVANGW